MNVSKIIISNLNEADQNNRLTLYHNTSNENAIKINNEGIIAGKRLGVYGKGSEAEGAGIWCTTQRGYGYGGATITFQVNSNDEALRKQNDTEFILYRDVTPEEIIDIDLVVSNIPCVRHSDKYSTTTVESDIPQGIKNWGKESLLKVYRENQHSFIEPYSYEQLVNLIETCNKYCKGTITLTESSLLEKASIDWNNYLNDEDKPKYNDYIGLSMQIDGTKTKIRVLQSKINKDKYDADKNKHLYLLKYYKDLLVKYKEAMNDINKTNKKNDVSITESTLLEKASIDWNNCLTPEEVSKFLSKDDKVESAEEIIYDTKGNFYNTYFKDFKNQGWSKYELTQNLADFYYNGHLNEDSYDLWTNQINQKSEPELQEYLDKLYKQLGTYNNSDSNLKSRKFDDLLNKINYVENKLGIKPKIGRILH